MCTGASNAAPDMIGISATPRASKLACPADGRCRQAEGSRRVLHRLHSTRANVETLSDAALRLRKTPFVVDGEAVVLGPDGISGFDRLTEQ
jgi:hypothetical protein